MKLKLDIRRIAYLVVGLGVLPACPQSDEAPIQVEGSYSFQIQLPSGTSSGASVGGINELLGKSNTGSMVNEFTGQAAFSVDLGGIGTVTGLNYSLGLSYYGGGTDEFMRAHPQYAPGSWVGAGFSLKYPYIQVVGEDADLESQKYFISLDGVSRQELVRDPSMDDRYRLKNNPLIIVDRVIVTRNHVLRDRCPYQVERAVAFSTQSIDYWRLFLSDGTEYTFGSDLADCGEWEICQPLVGNSYKYKPFYTLEQNGRSPVTFLLRRIKDPQSRTALFFRYAKETHVLMGACNSVHIALNSTWLDGAAYLHEVYATNGILEGSPQTSRIVLNTADKVEEVVYPQIEANPLAQYETKKLSSIEQYQNGIPTGTLYLNYGTRQGRMVLEKIESKAPEFSNRKRYLTLGYQDNSTRLTTVEDARGSIVEYGYGSVDAAPVNGSSSEFQFLELPLQSANSRIAFARQVGNKFYLQVENWSQGCINNLNETFREHLYEYENNGTYWSLRRTWNAPRQACPTAMDFFLSPDGKYFVWASANGKDNTRILINDLTLEGTNTQVASYDYTTTGGHSEHTDIYAYGDWFAAYNFTYKRNISFYRKTSAGTWTNSCPADIVPATYNPPSTLSSRSNNYSGEDEGIEANSCLTFSDEIQPIPGPDYVIVKNVHKDIFHLFANNGGIKDYVKGLESTTPPLDKFTTKEVNDGDLAGEERPWFRQTTSGVRYDNNGRSKLGRVVAGENIIALQYAANDYWKYMYVLGWDGHQLRYLYDEALHADMDSKDAPDEIDFAVGPDYFLLKNFYEGAGDRQGVFYYKVDLKKWQVTKTQLTGIEYHHVEIADYVMKANSDYFLLEAMNQTERGVGRGFGPQAFTPALTTEGTNSSSSIVGGIHYPSKYDIRVFMLDENRKPVDVSAEFARTEGGQYLKATNIAGQGDRILGVDTYMSGNQPVTLKYSIYRRNNNAGPGAKWSRYSMPGPLARDADEYYSSRLVTGGVMTTLFRKNNTEESFYGIRFYPDPAGRVPSASNPSNLVQGGIVVTSVTVKRNGIYSTGNQIQRIDLKYPSVSPDGAPGAPLKNQLSGELNFNYVKKEFVEGAVVSGFRRDELGGELPEKERSLIGTPIRNWKLPNKTSYQCAGGAWDSSFYIATTLPGLPSDAFATRKVRDSSRSYFGEAWQTGLTYYTFYDNKNGKPKVTISKSGDKYLVNLQIFEQDLNASYTGPNWNLLRQTATFQFPYDPCSRPGDNPDPCGNIDLAWFSDPIKLNIVASSILTYDGNRPKEVYQWRPTGQLGTVFPPLNGDPTSTDANWKWVKVQSTTRWQDHAVAQCKSDLPTELENMGVYTTRFYGGPECNALGSVQNSRLATTAILTGEEQINTAACPSGECMGAFGRWEAGGSHLQSQVVHTGDKAVATTGIFGPTINLKLREFPGFLDRKKGFVVSAWVLATANSNPAFRVEWRKAASPPSISTNDASQGDPLDLVQEYIAANGAFPTRKWVKLERLITFAELMGRGTFGTTPNHDYLRIWVGKGSMATNNAVYVDDIRLYPADAMVTTQNFDATGLLTSSLDAANEPTFFEYDVWRSMIGARNKDGALQATSAVNLIND